MNVPTAVHATVPTAVPATVHTGVLATVARAVPANVPTAVPATVPTLSLLLSLQLGAIEIKVHREEKNNPLPPLHWNATA